MNNSSKYNKAYTLLFAVITASIVLGVAVFILNVTRKHFELSVATRNSMASFYAADSGIECVLGDTNWILDFASTTGGTLACGNGQVVLTEVNPPQFYPLGSLINDPTDPVGNRVRQQSGFIKLDFNTDNLQTKQCAEIIITTGMNLSGERVMVVDSRGYNNCILAPTVSPDTSSITTVERALRLTQKGIW